MHGGRIFIRSTVAPKGLPKQVVCKEATAEDIKSIKKYIEEYCRHFGGSAEEYMSDKFFLLTPNSASPYKQLYTQNI